MADPWGLENLKAAFLYAEKGIYALLLLNGGAAIALLSLIGALWPKNPGDSAIAFELAASLGRFSLPLFLIGLALAAAAYLCAYLCQLGYVERWMLFARILHVVAVVLAFSGILAFLIGAFEARDAFARAFAGST